MSKINTSIDSSLYGWKLKVKVVTSTPLGMKFSVTKGEYQRADSIWTSLRRTFSGESRIHLMRYLESLYKDGCDLLQEYGQEKDEIKEFLKLLSDCTQRFRTLYSETPVVFSGLSLLQKNIEKLINEI